MEAIKVKQKTNRQENVKAYFQRLMILMAAIMVSTALVGCDETNVDDDDNGGTPSGKIDTKLIGEWSYDDLTLYGSEHHNYFFNKNGTASLFITGSMMYHGEAKYSTSGGKISLTEYYTIDAIGNKTLRIDKVVEYSIGTDERGEYLTIGNIPGLTSYGENRPNMKFRRVK